ncbi:integrative and conjugative element protein, VC0181 family [Marinobacter segnicrescens]|uniref:Integrative and conjugative element protein, VC0181 family n=1 Tax=Marinobacter segnicrescens TaxID=430453 RepID=A0A1I0D8Z9_9GAMM|nr:Mov34/MPN/PAD-1 family protein [Marinobacter segnicrescens]SET28007.1 integrative and conjugative element protein, VC0181 family [Marinobacter segnicrescens]
MSAKTSFPISFSLANTHVYVHQEVIAAFQQARQKKFENERFGVIIGSKNKDDECYWIEHLTKPHPGDQSSFTSFTLEDPAHQAIVNQKFIESEGHLAYLGTWHTHPEQFPEPSSVDRRDWRSCLARNGDRQLFFCIVGTGEFRFFKMHGGRFNRMRMTHHF